MTFWYRNHLLSEEPQHPVRITKAFWLGVTEVTQEEYRRAMNSNPSKFQGDPKRPVEQVSWDDAVEFCRKLSELPAEKAAKRRYRLPTEAQWEYACRAGSTGPWSFSSLPAGEGEKLLGEYAWFRANAGGQTHPVAQKRPNAWGLYDMYGNVWEWCQDWFGRDYYAKLSVDDPTGPATGSSRINRGGGLDLFAGFCRSANRGNATGRVWNMGFRVCLVLAEDTRSRTPEKAPETVTAPASPSAEGPRFERDREVANPPAMEEYWTSLLREAPNNVGLYKQRAELRARYAHKWSEAAEDLAKVIELHPQDFNSWHHRTMLLVKLQQRNLLCEHLGRMRARFQDDSSVHRSSLIHGLTTFPTGKPELIQGIDILAEKLLTEGYIHPVAFMCYRAGKHEEAESLFSHVVSTDLQWRYQQTLLLAFHAMNKTKLNGRGAARELLSKAKEAFKKAMHDDQGTDHGDYGEHWWDRLSAEALLAEAEGLIMGAK